MQLFPTEEQLELRRSVGRFLRDRASAGHGMRADASALPLWGEFATLGVLGIEAPEAHGGLERRFEDMVQILEEVGESAWHLPLIPTLSCLRLISTLGSEDQCRSLLPAIIAGESPFAFAYAETTGQFDAPADRVKARKVDGGWIIDGRKRQVIGLSLATHAVVTAHTVNEPCGQRAYVVRLSDPGIQPVPYISIDGHGEGELVLSNAFVPDEFCLAREHDVEETVAAAIDDAVIAASFEAVGSMRALLRKTIDYAKTRQQFGHPLADNQAIKHRIADMAVHVEEAAAIAWRALLGRSGPAGSRSYAVSSAKVKISRAGRFVFESAIQVHGAMGVTQELDVGARARRLLGIELSFGTPADHQRRLTARRAAGAAACAGALGAV